MSDSGREQLFDQVQTDLEGIEAGATYNNSIRYVTRDLMGRHEIPEFPAIIMVEETEEQQMSATPRELFLRARLTLVIHAKTTPGTAASTLVNSLCADVKVAMIGDTNWTHGGHCHRTVYVGMDPLAVDGAEACGAVMTFDLHYSHTWNTP